MRKFVALILALAIIVVWHSCKYVVQKKNDFFYPSVANPIPCLEKNIEVVLLEFETTLKEKNRTAYDALNPGLTAERIKQLELQYDVTIPEEMIALYKWHNGCGDSDTGLTENTLIPGHWFVPLEQALQWNSDARKGAATMVQKVAFEFFAGHRKRWIVLLDDGCGDGYFFDPARSSDSTYVFYHFAEIGYYVFFPSLSNAFQSFIDCYQQGIYRPNDEATLQKDYEAESKIMSKYGVIVNGDYE